MDFRSIFLNKHSELRTGWRILAFVAVLTAMTFAVLSPVYQLNVPREYIGSALFLICILVSSYIMTRFLNRKPFAAIGLWLNRAAIRDLLMGTFLGFLMMSAIFLVEYGAGFVNVTVRDLGMTDILMILLSSGLFFALGAAVEEALFRGYLFQTLMQGITFLPAMIFAAAVFAFAHGSNPNVSLFSFVNIGLASAWLSFAYLKVRNLWLPFGLHFGWNFSQTSIYGFPTSGISFDERKLLTIVQSGPDWLTGGVFGPEGGALATAALVACTWYIVKSKLLVAPEGVVTLDSIEDLVMPEIAEEGQR